MKIAYLVQILKNECLKSFDCLSRKLRDEKFWEIRCDV